MLLLLGVLKILHVTVAERVWTAALSQFWQARCLDHHLPGDRIAYLAGPADLAMPTYLADFSAASRSTWTGAVGASPYPIELAELQRLAASSPDIPWESLPGPVFLHGLEDSRRRRWMVTVYALANNPTGWWTLVATARDLVDLRAARAPAVVSAACWPLPHAPGDTIVVFAGQPDPLDASRFTLRVGVNGQSQTVTGLLRKDGSVEFVSSTGLSPWNTSRAGPLLLPAVD